MCISNGVEQGCVWLFTGCVLQVQAEATHRSWAPANHGRRDQMALSSRDLGVAEDTLGRVFMGLGRVVGAWIIAMIGGAAE